jgi:hypothetical protein
VQVAASSGAPRTSVNTRRAGREFQSITEIVPRAVFQGQRDSGFFVSSSTVGRLILVRPIERSAA